MNDQELKERLQELIKTFPTMKCSVVENPELDALKNELNINDDTITIQIEAKFPVEMIHVELKI